MTNYPNLRKLPPPDSGMELRKQDLECYLINYEVTDCERVGTAPRGTRYVIYRLCQEIKMLRGW